jgi:uncharacterized membrane protein YfcA
VKPATDPGNKAVVLFSKGAILGIIMGAAVMKYSESVWWIPIVVNIVSGIALILVYEHNKEK